MRRERLPLQLHQSLAENHQYTNMKRLCCSCLYVKRRHCNASTFPSSYCSYVSCQPQQCLNLKGVGSSYALDAWDADAEHAASVLRGILAALSPRRHKQCAEVRTTKCQCCWPLYWQLDDMQLLAAAGTIARNAARLCQRNPDIAIV